MVDREAQERLRAEAEKWADAFRASMAERVKARRAELGWTQNQLAGEAGISVGTVQGAESGDREPQSENAFLLAKALGHTVHWLYFGKD